MAERFAHLRRVVNLAIRITMLNFTASARDNRLDDFKPLVVGGDKRHRHPARAKRRGDDAFAAFVDRQRHPHVIDAAKVVARRVRDDGTRREDAFVDRVQEEVAFFRS